MTVKVQISKDEARQLEELRSILDTDLSGVLRWVLEVMVLGDLIGVEDAAAEDVANGMLKDSGIEPGNSWGIDPRVG
jgi:hypothetical protein